MHLFLIQQNVVSCFFLKQSHAIQSLLPLYVREESDVAIRRVCVVELNLVEPALTRHNTSRRFLAKRPTSIG